MKKRYLLLALAIFGLSGISSVHAQLDPSFLKCVKVFPFGNGRLLNTYEDVSGITFNPKVSGGAPVSLFKKSSIPSGYVSAATAQSWIAKMYPNALCSEEFSDISSLIAAKFYLDFGYNKAGVWFPQAMGKAYSGGTSLSFPHSYPQEQSNNPRSQRYYYCMEGGGYEYVTGSVDYQPDALSCRECQSLCSCPSTKTTTPDLDGNPVVKWEINHSWGDNNIYRNFKSTVLGYAAVAEAPAITGDSSGIYAQINFEDRTPPWVLNCIDYVDRYGTSNKRFPTLGENRDTVTTGDWYNCNQLEITENRADVCTTKMSLGKIDIPLRNGENWTDFEDWDNDTGIENVRLSGENPKSGKLNTTFLANINYGYMRYTIFAEDTETYDNNGEDKMDGGNLNPGCASIVEDDPGQCYGLPNGGDLGSSVGDAKPWPYSPKGDKSYLSISTISGKDRTQNQEGLIRLTDNDLPNILIKLTSVKDGKSIFFPPCMPAGELIVRNSPDYYGKNGTNQQDYNAFVGSSIITECNYITAKTSCSQPYFKLLKLEASDWANESDKSVMAQLLNNDKDFVTRTFRLEDQEHSDTDTNGYQETINDNGEAGQRNGTWKNCVAFIDSTINPNIRIQEDVEYKLEIWTDDSVKWSNITSSFPTTSPEDNRVISIPTGIRSGEITLNIPNQYPQIVDKAFSFDCNKSINECKIVFREPTENVTINSEEDLVAHKFPYVTIKATDHSGNERTIKLYFSVLDENASIKTLQRKHDQH